MVDGDVVAVVCDGISSSASADLAARRAAAATGAVLADALRDGSPAGRRDTQRDPRGAGRRCAAAADAPRRLAAPSCTLVSALVREDELVIGWLGDSRAYWIAPSVARQLTVDDSWASEQVVTVAPTASGRLVLCTDGLWNYAPGAADLAELLDDLPAAASAAAVARSLTDIALARGGHDNITVAVVDVRPQRRSLS
ncbi:MAG: PP2C family protein-serine/threonine phosphatase [Solirubrobacteraceae bacterium]